MPTPTSRVMSLLLACAIPLGGCEGFGSGRGLVRLDALAFGGGVWFDVSAQFGPQVQPLAPDEESPLPERCDRSEVEGCTVTRCEPASGWGGGSWGGWGVPPRPTFDDAGVVSLGLPDGVLLLESASNDAYYGSNDGAPEAGLLSLVATGGRVPPFEVPIPWPGIPALDSSVPLLDGDRVVQWTPPAVLPDQASLSITDAALWAEGTTVSCPMDPASGRTVFPAAALVGLRWEDPHLAASYSLRRSVSIGGYEVDIDVSSSTDYVPIER